MQFHEPGMPWIDGRMSMAAHDGPEVGLQLRLVRNKALPWVTADYTENFDQVLNFSMNASTLSETFADHPFGDFPSAVVSSKFAEGRFCHGGGFWEQILLEA